VPPAVEITGDDLTVADVIAVARNGAAATLAPAALERVRTGWEIVRRAAAEGRPVYGLTTGVGAHKRVAVDVADTVRFNDLLLKSHLVAQGPKAPAEVVRAALLRMVNGFAKGTGGVRPELVERLLETLNSGRIPAVRTLGSVGQADLAPLADLAVGSIGDLAPRIKGVAEPDPEHEPAGSLDHPYDVVLVIGLYNITQGEVVEEEGDAAEFKSAIPDLSRPELLRAAVVVHSRRLQPYRSTRRSGG